ncbi:transglutaminase-like domain-containing protein [Chryseobacterium sp.]|uniref:transglutaminase-like domain-containing protein n=1 Tax=Chryseobacterium sp. TaxID=1871047 RepID=UPI0031DCF6E4
MRKNCKLALLGLFTTGWTSAQIETPELGELRQGKEYNISQKQTFPDFSYQSSGHADLTKIRTKYGLDAIAGKGSDIERAKRLLKWFHEEVPHNDAPNIESLNAISIIDSYRTKKQAHGCYPLSIAMNEVFLAMGFQSRTVICFSGRYPSPEGGHVINSVYIPSLKKWIYMDPQDNAYIMDENDNLLSIAEVRERLISGGVLKLNADANYHGKADDLNDYLYTFMAKNLYRLICPLKSEFGSQTRAKGRTIQYVELLPVASKDPVVDGFETNTNAKTGVNVINFHTNNDRLFWKKP